MADIDWNAHAEVHAREDGGSDMYYDFKVLKSGALADVVRWTRALSSDDRARVVIDARGMGTINIHDIDRLAQRPDFPSA